MANIYQVKSKINDDKLTIANLGSREDAQTLADWLNEYCGDMPNHKDNLFFVEELDGQVVIADIINHTMVARYQWVVLNNEGEQFDKAENQPEVSTSDFPLAIARKPELVLSTIGGGRGILVGIDTKLGLKPAEILETAKEYAKDRSERARITDYPIHVTVYKKISKK